MNIFLEYVLTLMGATAQSIYGASKLIALNVVEKKDSTFGIDTSIESMNSQEFSVAIFYFLVVAIIIFTIFIFMFMFKDRSSKLKTGEKWMFAWLLFGVVAAVIFGATQMLHGYLF